LEKFSKYFFLKVTVKKSTNIYFKVDLYSVEFTIHHCIWTKQECLTEQQIINKYCQILEFQINSHKYFLAVTGTKKKIQIRSRKLTI